MRPEAGGVRRNGVAAVSALLLCLFFATPHASALTPQDEARYQTLINQLRCLVCQNQTIADSNAPLAADLREQVKKQIEAGRSDAEIKAYLTDRYGDFVLYKPPFKPTTWLLWIGPFVLLLLAVLLALRFTRRRASPVAPPVVDAQALQALLDAEHREDEGARR